MSKVPALGELYDEIRRESELSGLMKGRNLVFGEGGASPVLLLIGEAPGGEEARLGRPFVGKAGKNLDRFLALIGQKREDIYITNLVKLRPTKINPITGRLRNSPPSLEEVGFFRPFLFREIALLAPEIIVTLGNFPLRAMLDDKTAVIGELHGRFIETERRRVFPLYHPAAVIYNRSLEAAYTEDLLRLKGLIKGMKD